MAKVTLNSRWPEPARPDVHTPEDWRKWYTEDLWALSSRSGTPRPNIVSFRVRDPDRELLGLFEEKVPDRELSFWPVARGAGGWATSHE